MRISRADAGYLSERETAISVRRGDPYQKQYQDFVDDSYGWSDSWSRALVPLGYECWEPVANAAAMQLRWGAKYSVNFTEKNWEPEIVAAQVRGFAPEVILVDDHLAFSAEQIERFRSEAPSIKLVIVWCGSPPGDAAIFRAADLTLSNIPELVTLLTEGGARVKYMPHAFDPIVLERIETTAAKDYDLTFVGSIVSGKGYHGARRELLEALLQRANLVLFSPVWMPSRFQRIKRAVKTALKGADPAQRDVFGWNLNAAVRENIRPGVYGRRMFEVLQRSRAVLNNHIDVSRHSASNMRMFEVTGVGTCLLTDWKENIGEFFEPDKEVVTYSSVEECIEKARWLAGNEAAREEIAKAGQVRTLRDHSFARRAERLDEIIRGELGV